MGYWIGTLKVCVCVCVRNIPESCSWKEWCGCRSALPVDRRKAFRHSCKTAGIRPIPAASWPVRIRIWDWHWKPTPSSGWGSAGWARWRWTVRAVRCWCPSTARNSRTFATVGWCASDGSSSDPGAECPGIRFHQTYYSIQFNSLVFAIYCTLILTNIS